MRNAARRIYIALIFIFLYAPIATLIVLSFNEQDQGKMGRLYAEMVSESLSERCHHAGALEHAGDCPALGSHFDCHRHNRLYLLAGNEEEGTNHQSRNRQHPDAER